MKLFDRSTAAKLIVSGPDAPAFLSNLSTNDIKALPLGGGCETYFLDHRAKTLFQAWAYHVRLPDLGNAIWLETTPGRNAELLAHLDRYLISEAVELRDVTADYAQFHLLGDAVLAAAVGGPVPVLAEFQHMARTAAGTECSVRRRSLLGTPGFDIVCPAEKATAVKAALLAAGATDAGADEYEILRVEAGTPEYGPDIDATRFVMEIADVARAVSYTKGCFIGQEPIVMARDRAGHVARAFLGLKVLGDTLPPHGAKLVREGQEVGVVTSAVKSERLGSGLALGYVRRGHQDVGTRLDAVSNGSTTPVEVIGWPPVR